MARRCGCASGSCSCVIQAGEGISVTGSGSSGQPYVISADDVPLTGKFQVQDTDTVNLALNGQGTLAEPYVLTADVELALGELTDVDDTNATPGYVLGRLPDGSFGMLPPSTAPVGAINHDTSLIGDGSAGDPLGVFDYDNIAFLDTADPANLPNLGDLTIGSPTDPNDYAFHISRQGQADHSFAAARLRNYLYSAGPTGGGATGGGYAAHWQLEEDGDTQAAMRLYRTGWLTTSSDGTSYHPLPFRTFARSYTVNGAVGYASLPITFPAGRFTDTPVITLTVVNGGTQPILVYSSARSAAGFTLRMGRADGGSMAGQQFTVSMHAVQMEP